MEQIIEINTLEGQTSFQTENFKGKLNAIIVESMDKCEFIIESSLGYLILARREHAGVIYYCPRTRTTTPTENLMDHPQFEKFQLNEELFITIRGTKNLPVKFIFRFE